MRVNARPKFTKDCIYIYAINNLKHMQTVQLIQIKEMLFKIKLLLELFYDVIYKCYFSLVVFFTIYCQSCRASYTTFFLKTEINLPFQYIIVYQASHDPLISTPTYYTACCIQYIDTFLLILFQNSILKGSTGSLLNSPFSHPVRYTNIKYP